MKAVCSVNPTHSRFVVQVQVLQEWMADARGNCLSVIDNVESEDPSPKHQWWCAECDEVAFVYPDGQEPEDPFL